MCTPKISITLHEGRKLLAADANGKSDPYVIFEIPSVSRMKSPVVKKNLNPSWNYSFELEGNSLDQSLLITVWDKDKFMSDDFLGSLIVQLPKPGSPIDKQWFKLQEVSTGEIMLSISCSDFPLPLGFTGDSTSGSLPTFQREGKSSPVRMGPVLVFKGVDEINHHYRVSALVVVPTLDSPGSDPYIKISPAPVNNQVKIDLLKNQDDHQLYRYDFAIQQLNDEVMVTYSILSKKENVFYVPGKNTKPRLVYTSCNGFSNPEEKIKEMKEFSVNNMWLHLKKVHNEQRFHLLLQGGDQVYADPAWSKIKALADFKAAKSDSVKAGIEYSKETSQAVRRFFFNLYTNHWGQEEIGSLLASIPMINMWDDHDIFDGWGSYFEPLQSSPIYKGVFIQAKKHFAVFQLGIKHNEVPPCALKGKPQNSFSNVYVVGGVAIACWDMRSERQISRIFSDETYQAMESWLESLADPKLGVHHLVVMSGVPVVYNDLEFVETFLELVPGQQGIEDDLRDHWSAKAHKIERVKFVKMLLNFASKHHCRVSVVAGDVHLGALGVLVSTPLNTTLDNSGVINNLTSSPIGNVLPPPGAQKLLRKTGKKVDEITNTIKAQLVKFPDGRRRRYISARNYLTMRFDNIKGCHVQWHAEGDPVPYAIFIHPYTPGRREDIKIMLKEKIRHKKTIKDAKNTKHTKK